LFSLLRSESAARKLAELGASVALVSAFDTDAVERALREAEAEVVIDQLTSLPKDPAHLAAALPGDRKLRIEGGGNLYRAAEANGVRRYLQQSSGFFLKPGDGLADESESLAVNASPGVAWSARMYTELETRALSSNQMEGVVLRYGFFYGPGTWYKSGRRRCGPGAATTVSHRRRRAGDMVVRSCRRRSICHCRGVNR
jgi:2-alkyl-3-oxoalkanoate reductase